MSAEQKDRSVRADAEAMARACASLVDFAATEPRSPDIALRASRLQLTAHKVELLWDLDLLTVEEANFLHALAERVERRRAAIVAGITYSPPARVLPFRSRP